MTQHVLVPFDESDSSDLALEYSLAEYPEVTITVLHVVDTADLYDGATPLTGGDTTQQSGEEQAVVQDARKKIADHSGNVATETLTGSPATSIIEYTEENNIDHIVIGSHGRTGASRVLLGSVAEEVVRRAPTPVTVVR